MADVQQTMPPADGRYLSSFTFHQESTSIGRFAGRPANELSNASILASSTRLLFLLDRLNMRPFFSHV